MFVPSHNENLINSALKSEADILIFDFEDSVPLGDLKQKARQLYNNFYRVAKTKFTIWVRVNDVKSDQLNNDFKALLEFAPDVILYPKVETRDDFEDRMALQYSLGLTSKGAALIESPLGLVNISEIAKSKFISALIFGNEDYEAEIFSRTGQTAADILPVRATIAINAKANDLLAIDTVTIDFKNENLLRDQISSAVRLGFDGKLCLSPREVKVVNELFSPTKQEIAEANKILELNELSIKNGSGVALMSSKFIGPPMVKKAQKLISYYERGRK